MNKTIESLWSGDIALGENCGVGDPEIENVVILLERNKEKLESKLCPQQKVILEEYIDCTEEYTRLISTCAFCDGFKLASKLMAEALWEDI